MIPGTRLDERLSATAWTRIRGPELDAMQRDMRAAGAEMLRAWQQGPVRAIVAREPGRDGVLRWHISISCADRYPTWDELKAARYGLVPHDVWMAMWLPPPDAYVDTHPFCFHWHEAEPQHGAEFM